MRLNDRKLPIQIFQSFLTSCGWSEQYHFLRRFAGQVALLTKIRIVPWVQPHLLNAEGMPFLAVPVKMVEIDIDPLRHDFVDRPTATD